MGDGFKMVLIYVRLRDGQERMRRVRIKSELLAEVAERLINAVDVREFSIAEETHRHHKSYAEDFDVPPDGEDFLEMLRQRNDPPLIDPKSAEIVDFP